MDWFLSKQRSKPYVEKVKTKSNKYKALDTAVQELNKQKQALDVAHHQYNEMQATRNQYIKHIEQRKREKLTPQNKEKIILHGKYWKEKNLKALNTHESIPLKNAKQYTVKLITVDGDDLFIEHKKFVSSAFGPVGTILHFWVPGKCLIIGIMIYDGDILMQALPTTHTRFQVPGNFTLNLNDPDYKNGMYIGK